MSRAKPSRGTVLTALLIAAAFLAGSATYLALKDSFGSTPVTPVQEEPYFLKPTQPRLGQATVVVEEPEQIDQEGTPQGSLVAAEPNPAAVSTIDQPEELEVGAAGEGVQEPLPVSSSMDIPVKQLFVKPVEGPICKSFSGGELVYSETLGDYRTHAGTDIAAEVGAKVRAMADGTVSDLYFDDRLGSVIEITHENGTVTRYCNLMENHVAGMKVGAAVKMGDVISGVGKTALSENAEQAHLHIEAIREGVAIDPETLFQ